MKKLSALFMLCVIFGITYGQKKNELQKNPGQIDKIIYEARHLASTDPQRALHVLEETKKEAAEINYKKGILDCSNVLLIFYYNRGEYQKVIDESHITETLSKELGDKEAYSDSYRMRGISYCGLGLNSQGYKEFKKALVLAEQIPILDRKYYKMALVNESIAWIYKEKGDERQSIDYRKKCIFYLNKMEESNHDYTVAKHQLLALQYLDIGLAYVDSKNDSALYYLKKAHSIHQGKKYNISHEDQIILLSEIGKFYLLNQKYQLSLSYSKRAENIEKKVNMPYLRRNIYKTLYKSYSQINKQDSVNHYLKLYTNLNDSIVRVEKANIDVNLKDIISNNNNEHENSIKFIYFLAVSTIIIVLVIGFFFWKRNQNKLHKKYKVIIEKLNNDKKNPSESFSKVQSERGIVLTDETVKVLLLKLQKFEESQKFLRKDVNLTHLANTFNTNTRYLSDVINQHKGKNFHNYLNELRIQYITELLYKEPKYREYKVSYLAEVSGFASREVFSVVFKKETGVTPSYFINSLRKDESEV